MSVISGIVLGAVGASVLWMFAVAWLLDALGAQRKALSAAQVTLRLYRETRTDSDTQIRELLGQNERLARQLIERAEDIRAGSGKAGLGSVWIPPTRFSEARES